MKGAVAGVLAAGAWAAAEPLLGRALGTPFSDVRLLGRTVTRGRLWPLAGLAMHLGNGAAFGAACQRFGQRGVCRGLVLAEIENLALWPGMLVVDRLHPDRREGRWPQLACSGRVFAYEVTTHAIFGATLGALLRDA